MGHAKPISDPTVQKPTIVMDANNLNVANALQVSCMFLRWTLLGSKRYSSITIGLIYEYLDVGGRVWAVSLTKATCNLETSEQRPKIHVTKHRENRRTKKRLNDKGLVLFTAFMLIRRFILTGAFIIGLEFGLVKN